jgi:hypothetical protein
MYITCPIFYRCILIYYLIRNQTSSLGTVTSLLARWPKNRVRFSEGTYIILISIMTRPPLGTTRFPIRWILGAFSQRVKRTKRKSDHSPLSSGKVRNSWSYASTSHMFFMDMVLQLLTETNAHTSERKHSSWAPFCYIFIHLLFSLATCMVVAIDVVLDWWLNLSTTLTHDSWLHLILAPSLNSALYNSPLHTHYCSQVVTVSTSRFLVTASNNGYSSVSVLKLSLNGGSLPTACILYGWLAATSHQPPSLPFTAWLSTDPWTPTKSSLRTLTNL